MKAGRLLIKQENEQENESRLAQEIRPTRAGRKFFKTWRFSAKSFHQYFYGNSKVAKRPPII